jgi:hypothetical protein
MPLRRRSEGKAHKLDIKGIAVAIAFLLIVSLFAGGRDAHTAGQNRPTSLQIAPTTSAEKPDPIQLQKSHLPHSSRSLNALR